MKNFFLSAISSLFFIISAFAQETATQTTCSLDSIPNFNEVLTSNAWEANPNNPFQDSYFVSDTSPATLPVKIWTYRLKDRLAHVLLLATPIANYPAESFGVGFFCTRSPDIGRLALQIEGRLVVAKHLHQRGDTTRKGVFRFKDIKFNENGLLSATATLETVEGFKEIVLSFQ